MSNCIILGESALVCLFSKSVIQNSIKFDRFNIENSSCCRGLLSEKEFRQAIAFFFKPSSNIKGFFP